MQSTSEPIDFYYLPSAYREAKPPVMAAPVFVAPLPAPPVAAVAAAAAASPQFHQVVQAPKQLQKRGREVHHAPDEQSSGSINFDQLQEDCMHAFHPAAARV